MDKLKHRLRRLKKYRLMRKLYGAYQRRISKTIIKNKGCGHYKKDIIGQNNLLIIGSDSILCDTHIYIRGNGNKLIIGNSCRIGPQSSFYLVGNNCVIEVGNRTSFSAQVHINAEEDNSQISIGESCMFANKIEVRTSDSHTIYDINSNERLNPPQPINIGNHVWIAAGVKVMKGVKLNDNCIIGAGSIVTHDIPSHCIAAGIPAKVIKSNVNWEK